MKARHFLIPVLGLLLFSAAGCVTAQRAVDQAAPNPEPAWIIDGRAAEFEGEFWLPQDDIENLMDSEVRLVGSYQGVELFVERADIKPYNRLYTRYGHNKYRLFEKN